MTEAALKQKLKTALDTMEPKITKAVQDSTGISAPESDDTKSSKLSTTVKNIEAEEKAKAIFEYLNSQKDPVGILKRLDNLENKMNSLETALETLTAKVELLSPTQ